VYAIGFADRTCTLGDLNSRLRSGVAARSAEVQLQGTHPALPPGGMVLTPAASDYRAVVDFSRWAGHLHGFADSLLS